MKRISLLALTASGLVFAATEWKDLSPEGGRVTRIAIDPRTPSTIYAATNAGLFKTIDAGASWSKSAYNPARDPGIVPSLAIDPRNSATLYVAHCDLSKSTDGGITWRSITQTVDRQDNCIQSVAVDPRNAGTLYAA